MTCFRPRNGLFGVKMMGDVTWGKYSPKTDQKGAWIGSLKPKRQNLYIAISPKLLIRRTVVVRWTSVLPLVARNSGAWQMSLIFWAVVLENTSGIWRQQWPWAHSAGSLWRQTFRQAAVERWFVPILRYATSSCADGPSTFGRPDPNRNSFGSGLELVRLVAILGVRISPRPTPKQLRLVSADGRLVPSDILIHCLFRRAFGRGSVPLRWRTELTSIYKSVCVLCGILFYRQDVVKVGAGRTSRSAKFATSSELLYLLNLLYNTLIECSVEYKLIQLYQKSSVWCIASHIHLPLS